MPRTKMHITQPPSKNRRSRPYTQNVVPAVDVCFAHWENKNMQTGREHRRTAMAIGAHPDDIEFMMGGTLVLLKQAGFEVHYLNVASGSCGTTTHSVSRIRSIRRSESMAAAGVLGAIYHASLVDDLEIFYEPSLLARLAAVVREVNPSILLVPSPQDYMEDHTNTCRLAVTAAFARGMPNFRTVPSRRAVEGKITIYHAMPHGLRDPLRKRIVPGLFVNTTPVQTIKRQALAMHRSQQDWLDQSQGINRYLETMETFARELGKLSGCFEFAEGWRRHLHYGFCDENDDPLLEALGNNCIVNERYERELEIT
ncbi:MAG: PIG-L family deacetylase [Verrucomicrobiae bacterium]|nr:PIG-L family deacetylase [Verrucomicrobiae bacterium]